MSKKKSFNPVAVVYQFLFGVVTAVVATLVLSYPVFYLFVKMQKLNELVGLSVARVMRNYHELMWYLLSPLQDKLRLSDFPTSVSGAKHFYEVKNLFQLALAVFVVGILLWLFLKKKNYQLTISKATALLFMIIPIVILPFALMNFDVFFTNFHQLLFNNSDWLFDPTTDPIINVLPEDFFATMFSVFLLVYEIYFARFLLGKK